jgi:hypothetical protein
MQNRRRVVASVAVVAAAAISAGAVAGLALSGAPVSTDPSSPSATAGPQQAGAPNAPVGSASDSPTNRPGTTDGSRSTKGGVETLPETPGATPSTLVDLAKPDRTPLPTWDDLPAQSVAARGRLVEGYPTTLLPAAPRALILTSSLSPSAGRVQLALVARRDQSPAAVLRFYRARLTSAGFQEKRVAAAAGARSAAFVRAGNRVVVTVDPGSRQTYSVWATLATGKA